MRRSVLILVLVALPGAWAQAQDNYPAIELLGGYSYGSIDGTAFLDRQSGSGWGASASFNFHENIGVTADFAGQYGDAEVFTGIVCILLAVFPPPPGCDSMAQTDFSATQFLFGPRLAKRTEKWTAFGHALFGVARLHQSSFTLEGDSFRFPASTQTDFAMGYGGGIDLNTTERVAIRLFQVDYLPVRQESFASEWKQNLRVQAGVVFRFGGR